MRSVGLKRALPPCSRECVFDGVTYYVGCSFAGDLSETGPYPRIHLLPETLKIRKYQQRPFVLLTLSSHVDETMHRTNRERDEEARLITAGVRHWFQRRFLGHDPPTIAIVAELRDGEPHTPTLR